MGPSSPAAYYARGGGKGTDSRNRREHRSGLHRWTYPMLSSPLSFHINGGTYFVVGSWGKA